MRLWRHIQPNNALWEHEPEVRIAQRKYNISIQILLLLLFLSSYRNMAISQSEHTLYRNKQWWRIIRWKKSNDSN
jgi:hypothetical protein